jgi:iron-sulfur cluster repair protein YtfE (RIC family)
MKRNKALHPLSHDHHHGLIIAQLIKKGSPEYPKLPKTTEGKLDYTIKFYNEELIKHFDNEENILFPFVYGRDSEIDSLIEELKAEHKKIKDLITVLKENKDIENAMDELGKLLEMHIRKEERKVFNLIEKHLSNNELKIVGELLTGSRQDNQQLTNK